MDKIYIRGLELETVIGVYPEERREKQKVVLDLEIGTDMSAAGHSDDFRDALDYSALEKAVAARVEGSSFLLLERLAEEVARTVLEFPAAREVRVMIDKPGAALFARSVAVGIERRK